MTRVPANCENSLRRTKISSAKTFRRTLLLFCLAGAVGLMPERGYTKKFGAPGALKFSIEWQKNCEKHPHPKGFCSDGALLVDPPMLGLTEIHFTINYDSTRWSFDAAGSGPLCELSVGGGCPAPNARIGTFAVENLAAGTVPGLTLPGSTLNLTNDAVAGLVTVQYNFGAPVEYDLTDNPDRNFFLLSFHAFTPFRDNAQATYYDKPGAYQFSQSSAGCTTTRTDTGCGSDTPVEGFDLSSGVPEPSTWLAAVAGFGAIGGSLRARRRPRLTPTGTA